MSYSGSLRRTGSVRLARGWMSVAFTTLGLGSGLGASSITLRSTRGRGGAFIRLTVLVFGVGVILATLVAGGGSILLTGWATVLGVLAGKFVRWVAGGVFVCAGGLGSVWTMRMELVLRLGVNVAVVIGRGAWGITGAGTGFWADLLLPTIRLPPGPSGSSRGSFAA